MKIEINVDSTEDGLTGGFEVHLGQTGIEFLQKLRDLLKDPDDFVKKIGNSVMDGVLYGGSGNKSTGTAVAQQSGSDIGY